MIESAVRQVFLEARWRPLVNSKCLNPNWQLFCPLTQDIRRNYRL